MLELTTQTSISKDIKAANKCKLSKEGAKTNLRSQVLTFNFKTHCCLCGNIIDQVRANKNPNVSAYQYSHNMTLEFQQKIVANCDKRLDDWSTVNDHQSMIYSLRKPYITMYATRILMMG